MKKTALITGASSGIGTEFAHQLAQRDYNLVLVARRKELLDEIAKDIQNTLSLSIYCFSADLSTPAGLQDLYKQVEQQNLDIDLLVNNAGFGTMGAFEEQDRALEQQEIALNVAAVVDLSHQFIPAMLKRKSGNIINVASVAAYQPVPYMAVYAATKAFVLSFSEALWAEYREQGVTVTALCPGPVDTGFFDATGNKNLQKAKAKIPMMQCDEVVEAALQAMDKQQSQVIPGAKNRIAPFATRILSRPAMAKLVAKTMRPRRRKK